MVGILRRSEQKKRWGKKALQEGNNQKEAGRNVHLLLADLKSCSKTRNLNWGKQVHAEAKECGHDSSMYVANALINMYAKCGSMVDARQIFDCRKHPTVVSWTTLILGYAENGQGHVALDLFSKMRKEGPTPNAVTFVAALKACSSVALKDGASQWVKCRDKGKEIHDFVTEINCTDVYVKSTLIDMYAKCGSMVYARRVFNCMKRPDVVSWNVLILGYAENGEGHTALELFTRMKSEGPAPNSGTFVAALKSCICLAVKGGASKWAECRAKGNEIHDFAVKSGCISYVYVQSTLIEMYAKCGSMTDAHKMFDSVQNPTVVFWNILILGYADNGQGATALDLFYRMRARGPAPDAVSCVAALKSCISLAMKGAHGRAECKVKGKEIHDFLIENGCISYAYVHSTLLDMYAKCGSMVDAWEVFDSVKHPTVVAWTAMILGYVDNGDGHSALNLFWRMKVEGPEPDSVTFVAALKACTSLAVKEKASQWEECRDRGKEIYYFALECCCDSDVYVQSALVDMYAKCNSMKDAREVFDSMKHPSVVSWTALISGYADNGDGQAAVELFIRMRTEGFAPDSVTFQAALKACGLVGALEFGRTIHSEIDHGNEIDMVLVTCLVNFYAKCGSLLEAQRVFDLHADKRDIVTWTALLAGFSSCGDNEAVFGLFDRMQDADLKPDGVTFLCILTCCSHAGILEKGKECFDSMSTKFGIIPTIEHYNCMVDIFGRANKLDDAMALLACMPCSPNDVTWMTILSACWKWKNVDIGRLAFQSLISLNGRNAVGWTDIWE